MRSQARRAQHRPPHALPWVRTPRGHGSEHVEAQVDFAMRGPLGLDLPAHLWRHDGRLTLALDLEEVPDPESVLVQALHAGLVERHLSVDLVHDSEVVLVLGAASA